MNSLGGGGGFGGQRGPTGQIGNKTPKGYRTGQMAQFTPEQMDLFGRSFDQASPDSYLSKLAGGDEATFNQIEAPALRQFSGLQGNLASRFSGMGMGARRSSGFQNAANEQASNFAQELQANRQGLQRQAMMDLRGLTSELLNYRPYENFMVKKKNKEPFWKQALGLISPIGGDIASGGSQNTENFLGALNMFRGGGGGGSGFKMGDSSWFNG